MELFKIDEYYLLAEDFNDAEKKYIEYWNNKLSEGFEISSIEKIQRIKKFINDRK